MGIAKILKHLNNVIDLTSKLFGRMKEDVFFPPYDVKRDGTVRESGVYFVEKMDIFSSC